MSVKIYDTAEIQDLLKVASGLQSAKGDERATIILHRIMSDLFRAIDELDVTPAEFWKAVNYLNELGQAGEAGLLAAGLGFEHYLDLRMDADEKAQSIATGTSRTIEGPLYVGGAPLAEGEARLDDGRDKGEVLFMSGHVRDLDGKPIAGAIIDAWHANTKGMYSHFDSSQSAFNLRRRIKTGPDGRYSFRSITPSGYGCPPNGPTQGLLNVLGRHGQRPAHIHFFVFAPGYRRLTTQINLPDDEYLNDDFAFATRDDLIVDMEHHDDVASIHARGLNSPYAEIEFDFALTALSPTIPDTVVDRKRKQAA